MADVNDKILRGRILRDRRDVLNRELKEVGEEIKELDMDIHRTLVEEGTELKRVEGNTVTPGWNEVVTPLDWDAVERFCLENQSIIYLQRRLSNNVVLEAIRGGVAFPGDVDKIPKLNFRRS